ncbi:hypothetical protein TG4357_00688 [Thalassovita gelatinovora]|uniref:Peptidase S74 domain-containing protein n=1 Tax=Thalassovita gelatinovora TaxID=53501 RepID=A0A0P1FVU1_THAGE|nr:hypothetical protein [Thalassovita gelatinovora]QIZ80944.1 hypothetical protein HFZ77_10900 [Thalassovita gelatinovora]CUH63463.1 hypothetical protein TG4357_00688 [Thalassovita gelatinovora]SEQ67361.1 hypothetical protein SAMN04488043_107191 [Thalassovita gelatinovora]
MAKLNRNTLKLMASSAIVALAGTASADQVFNDDVIVDGSLCVGVDCVNGEAFGFDTIRLKENNLRIKFDDTSSSASFPSNDWQLTANDSSNGGANKFSLDDITNSKTPFTIEATAPSHSLYVDDAGRLGLGTSTPVVDIHVVSGNTPTLRLAQDGSSGFTAQTFDVAANETNFFVRDATNGSTLPFRIKPGAPTSAIYIDSDGDIGMGAGTSPDTALHVSRSNGTAKILVEDTFGTTATRNMLALVNNGGSSITMENSNTSFKWRIFHDTASEEFRLTSNTDSDEEFVLDTSGNLTLEGTLTTSGSCSVGCDRVFDAEYEIMPLNERMDLMWANGYLPNVGPTAEDGPFNISDKMGRMLNELEHAHIYIGQLNDRIAALETRLATDAN